MSRGTCNGDTTLDFDIAIVGSGFAGSLTAMIGRRLGRRVALIERGRHPRFVIGESATPLADLLWSDLVTEYDLPRLLPLAKWGSWQRVYPQLPCGCKRGFTFLHHRLGETFRDDAERHRQLLVAASMNVEAADTHWFRADFDQFLVQEAIQLGAEYFEETTLERVDFNGDSVALTGRRQNQAITLRARYVIDATGPRGFLWRTLGLPEAAFDHFPATQGLYTHFTGVERCEGLGIWTGNELPPYPPDDAAVHHLFPGGWIWVLRFNHGITSAGAALTEPLARSLRAADGTGAWARLLERLPTVQAQFARAQPVRPFIHVPRLPFRSSVITGERWALLPYAAGFVDPLLSTGFPLTLLGISRLAAAIEVGPNTAEGQSRLAGYAQQTQAELLAAERLIAALYATLADAPTFNAVALLYFAAAAYSEITRRLRRTAPRHGFLLHDHPHFGPHARTCCEQAIALGDASTISEPQRRQLIDAVRRTIEPVDLTGLNRYERRNWYPIEPNDVMASTHKLPLASSLPPMRQ